MIQTVGKRDAPCVLVVDDEWEVLTSLADLLRKEFQVIITDDPDEAVGALETREVALLLTDQRMPKTSGAKLLATCSRVSPHTTRALITAYSDIAAVIEAVNEGAVYSYVAKPWQNDQLLGMVRSAVDKSCLEREGANLIYRLSEAAKVPPTMPDQAPVVAPGMPPARQNEVLRYSVETLTDAVAVLEQLKAIIPICMYCHKVKTAAGEWQDMLDFVMQHSTFLSHGICPTCYKPLSARMLNEGRLE